MTPGACSHTSHQASICVTTCNATAPRSAQWPECARTVGHLLHRSSMLMSCQAFATTPICPLQPAAMTAIQTQPWTSASTACARARPTAVCARPSHNTGVDLCNGVTCAALDQCHLPGTCSHRNGICRHTCTCVPRSMTVVTATRPSRIRQCVSHPIRRTTAPCASRASALVGYPELKPPFRTNAGYNLCKQLNVQCFAAPDACHLDNGACARGVCSFTPKPDWTSCPTNNTNADGAACIAGSCIDQFLCTNITCAASNVSCSAPHMPLSHSAGLPLHWPVFARRLLEPTQAHGCCLRRQ